MTGDPRTSPLDLPAGQHFHFCTEISQHLRGWTDKNILCDIHGAQRICPAGLIYSLTFPLAPTGN